jgi:hypothetical protein
MSATAHAEITGELLGRRIEPGSSDLLAEVVHVTAEIPNGPAENAFVFIERSGTEPRARYISWINYYDLDYVHEHQPDSWALVEPSEPYQLDARWEPFGWPDALTVPTVGDW